MGDISPDSFRENGKPSAELQQATQKWLGNWGKFMSAVAYDMKDLPEAKGQVETLNGLLGVMQSIAAGNVHNSLTDASKEKTNVVNLLKRNEVGIQLMKVAVSGMQGAQDMRSKAGALAFQMAAEEYTNNVHDKVLEYAGQIKQGVGRKI